MFLPLKNLDRQKNPGAENTEVEFTFRLVTDEDTVKRSSAFEGREILFQIRDDQIHRAFILNGMNQRATELRVTERTEDGRKLTIEDLYGRVRMLLSWDDSRGVYVISMNHPQNRYLLTPAMYLN